MHIALLTTGRKNTLTVQHLHHHPGESHATAPTHSRAVHLLILDARDMGPDCLNAATAKVAEIRQQHGLAHGVLLCAKPTLPLLVASIRCGLRDVITQYIGASHLRQLLRASHPGLTRREYRDIVSLLRTFNAFSTGDTDAIYVARRSEELARLAEELAEKQKTLDLEKDRLARLDQELRERTRRLDRQIARMQTDADIAPAASSNPPLGAPDFEAMSQRLDKRAAELDVREKLLNEMQTLLLSTPQGSDLGKLLSPGP